MKTNETKHTTGPWQSVLLTEYHRGYEWPIFTVRDAKNHCLAVVGDVDRATAEDNAANARLIAAAPEMLAALRDALTICEMAKRYLPKSIQNADRFLLLNIEANSIKAVIAKAEGRAE